MAAITSSASNSNAFKNGLADCNSEITFTTFIAVVANSEVVLIFSANSFAVSAISLIVPASAIVHFFHFGPSPASAFAFVVSFMAASSVSCVLAWPLSFSGD